MKSKDQVLNVFKEFHVSIEREIERKLKCVRVDNGGEDMIFFRIIACSIVSGLRK